MSLQLLSTDLVEQIHLAVDGGRDVSSLIGNLKAATLPGLVEYGCLRRLLPSLPSLPPAISTSALGQSLGKVVSEIGLTTSGIPAPQSISHVPQESEFATVQGVTEATSHPMEMLLMRFTQAAKGAGFPVRTANELQAAFNEMIENAVQHSSAPIPVLVGYWVRPGVGQFIVADVGRGIRASLQENPQFSGISTDAEAIQFALRDGVSRFVGHGGFGFRPIFKALANDFGLLRFRSKGGCWTMDGTGLDADHGIRHFPPELPGFQVAVTCRLSGVSENIFH